MKFRHEEFKKDLYTVTYGMLIARTGLSKAAIYRARKNGNPKLSIAVKLCAAIRQPLSKYIHYDI